MHNIEIGLPVPFYMVNKLICYNLIFKQPSTMVQLQANLDYSKCQGPHESFRIIGSLNDRKRKFSDIFGKAWVLSENVLLPEFATSTRVFREVIGASVKALKKMSSLGLWPNCLLCFAGLRTQKKNIKQNPQCRQPY